MSRLFVYDENMTDERAKITVAKMAAISDIVAPEKQYIQYTAEGEVTVMGGCVIAVGETSVFKTVETALTKANLDQGSDFAHGSDYYIYICDPGTDDQDEIYLISLNSSWPDGDAWDDTNTRKLGGFHYGRVRNVDDYGQAINTSGSVRGSGWESNTRVDIIPNSVWTTKHRPKCEPSGMVYLGNALWGDIAGERARRVGKRLPDYMEFTVAADGSPQGLDASNTNGWTATTNTARTAVGKIANAVSALNICDLVGNVWKWLNELCLDPTATTWAWHDVFSGYGQAYMPSATALRALIGGGDWNYGVHCGSRAGSCGSCPWYVAANVGVWCVCDSL